MGESTLWVEEELERAKRMYESGASLRDVAAEMGISKPTVAKLFRIYGVAVRKRSERNKLRRWTPEVQKVAIDLYRSYKSVHEIGEVLGMSGTTVHKYLSQVIQVRGMGPPIRDPSSRVCIRCKRRRNIATFPRDKSAPLGRGYACSSCNLWTLIEKRYGLTEAAYWALYEAQGRGCALCKSPLPRNRKGVHVDHCSSSRRVRGLTCSRCNNALGHFADDPNLLKAALRYLASCNCVSEKRVAEKERPTPLLQRTLRAAEQDSRCAARAKQT